jgi:putative intracellular protease/amidase
MGPFEQQLVNVSLFCSIHYCFHIWLLRTMVKVVIVSTSASILKGHNTGLWIEELAAPYYVWKDAGYDVVLASTSGGPVPIDANSMGEAFFTDPCKRFMHDAEGIGNLSHTIPVKDVNWSDVDAILLPGGHGTCVDFVDNPDLKAAVEHMYSANKVVAAVCHGPLGLCDCVRSDGTTPIVAGKTVTGFSDAEEEAVQLQGIVPYMLETKLIELGGKYEKADLWNSKVCVDGNLVTGQNPQSSEALAKKVVEILSAS